MIFWFIVSDGKGYINWLEQIDYPYEFSIHLQFKLYCEGWWLATIILFLGNTILNVAYSLAKKGHSTDSNGAIQNTQSRNLQGSSLLIQKWVPVTIGALLGGVLFLADYVLWWYSLKIEEKLNVNGLFVLLIYVGLILFIIIGYIWMDGFLLRRWKKNLIFSWSFFILYFGSVILSGVEFRKGDFMVEFDTIRLS